MDGSFLPRNSYSVARCGQHWGRGLLYDSSQCTACIHSPQRGGFCILNEQPSEASAGQTVHQWLVNESPPFDDHQFHTCVYSVLHAFVHSSEDTREGGQQTGMAYSIPVSLKEKTPHTAHFHRGVASSLQQLLLHSQLEQNW